MRGFRSIILSGRGLSGVVLPTVVLVAMSATFAAIALLRFRFDDTKTSNA
jgi:ABC-2 type transport system permease protein